MATTDFRFRCARTVRAGPIHREGCLEAVRHNAAHVLKNKFAYDAGMVHGKGRMPGKGMMLRLSVLTIAVALSACPVLAQDKGTDKEARGLPS